MLIFGEFNVFSPQDARTILGKAHRALVDGGLLLLEPHTFSAIERMGQQGPSWYSAQRGLFSDQPHLVLQEAFWDTQTNTTTIRYFVIDGSTGSVTRHAQSFQAYTDREMKAVLAENGFSSARSYASLAGHEEGAARAEVAGDLYALVAHKRSSAG